MDLGLTAVWKGNWACDLQETILAVFQAILQARKRFSSTQTEGKIPDSCLAAKKRAPGSDLAKSGDRVNGRVFSPAFRMKGQDTHTFTPLLLLPTLSFSLFPMCVCCAVPLLLRRHPLPSLPSHDLIIFRTRKRGGKEERRRLFFGPFSLSILLPDKPGLAPSKQQSAVYVHQGREEPLFFFSLWRTGRKRGRQRQWSTLTAALGHPV